MDSTQSARKEWEDSDIGDNGGVKVRVRSWVYGFVTGMRKKSPATIQKWVDAISTEEVGNLDVTVDIAKSNLHAGVQVLDDKDNCDKDNVHSSLAVNGDEKRGPIASTSHDNIKLLSKEKFNNFYHKLNVNTKRIDLKSLLAKTTEKFSPVAVTIPEVIDKDLVLKETCKESINMIKEIDTPKHKNDMKLNIKDGMDKRFVAKYHIGVLGRSASENLQKTPPRLRLNQIGRSFSVRMDNDIPATSTDSTDNLIYDIDDGADIIPSLDASPVFNTSIINSSVLVSPGSSHLDRNLSVPGRHHSPNSPLRRVAREHTVSEGHQSPHIHHKNPLLRDSSFQSDSSHCSSVESLLEARRPDAETILINLGFGPVQGTEDNILSKIPKRFLKPSQVKGVDTDIFLRNQHLAMHVHESSVLGYRGLLGNPHLAPGHVVASIMQRFSLNELNRMQSSESLLSNYCASPKSFRSVANTVLAQRQFMK